MQASREKALKSKAYTIEFNKLRAGSNSFEFALDTAFFNTIEGSPIKEADAVVNLTLDKASTLLELNFQLTGSVSTTCDNCLDEFNLPLKNEFSLLMKYSEQEDFSDDEIIYITKNLLEFDLTQYLYESFLLSIPLRKVCAMSEKKCNDEVVKHLNPEESGAEEKETNNPMWDKLKGILNNN
ncbi:MAG: DUF177 domain-containing protein [Bacteroidia bacterium]|nr:DUF177 domain-containing protein [Bacteroidia bacterium]